MRKDLEQKRQQAQSLFDDYKQSNKELLSHLSKRSDTLLQATEENNSLLQTFEKQVQTDLNLIEKTFQTSLLTDKKRLNDTCQDTFDPIDRSIEEEKYISFLYSYSTVSFIMVETNFLLAVRACQQGQRKLPKIFLKTSSRS